MSNLDLEIVVERPNRRPEGDSPAVAGARSVEIFVLACSCWHWRVTLWHDNWRTGIALGLTGPQAGYFPVYCRWILGGQASTGSPPLSWPVARIRKTFVTRAQLRRSCRCWCSFRRWCFASLRTVLGL